MAEKNNARRLKAMLNGNAAPPRPSQGVVETPVEDASPSPEALVRGKPYQTGFDDAEVVLLPEGAQLREPLQDIARRYVGARRRSGEALLEAARWLNEARHEAQHGEWQLFLDATGTSADAAERLLNIHMLAMQNPQFADSVRTNWLGQSAAALLARPSTPSEVVAEVLAEPEAPGVAEVQRKIRRPRAQQEAAQNPQFADFAPTTVNEVVSASNDGTERQATGLDLLRQVVRVLRHIEHNVDTLPAGDEAKHELDQIAHVLAAIRSSVQRR